jgi:Ca2+-binding EF-hand superfamily protein
VGVVVGKTRGNRNEPVTLQS